MCGELSEKMRNHQLWGVSRLEIVRDGQNLKVFMATERERSPIKVVLSCLDYHCRSVDLLYSNITSWSTSDSQYIDSQVPPYYQNKWV